jgi:hypothetical protein
MVATITKYLGLPLLSHFFSGAPVQKHDCNAEMIAVENLNGDKIPRFTMITEQSGSRLGRCCRIYPS